MSIWKLTRVSSHDPLSLASSHRAPFEGLEPSFETDLAARPPPKQSKR